MTTDTDKTDRNDEEALANLLRLAGERADIPLGVESRVYHRVQEEWRAATTRPSGDRVYAEVHRTWRRDAVRGTLRRWMVPVGVAASAILALSLLSQPEPPPPTVVATVAELVAPTASLDEYSTGRKIYAGDVLTTGPGGGLGLVLARNVTLRVDENTHLRADGVDRFTLVSGRVYADSGQFVYRDGGLEIHTDFGVVSDIGTQFAVAVTADALDIAVREGRVELAAGQDVLAARMGQRLTMPRGAAVSVSDLDTHDDYWDWIVELTPAYDLNAKSLLDFLKWAARETGRELLFSSDDSRMFAMRTDVHGSVAGLTPDEALQAILSTTTLSYRIERDRIVIEGHDAP